MADNLQTIRTMLQERVSGSGSDPIFEPTALNRIINAANKRLGRVVDWPWLRTIGTISWTANDTDGLNLETAIPNFRHLNYLAHVDRKLKFESPQAFIILNQATGTAPLYYTILGSTLFISPNPTEDVTLSYYATLDETDMTGDTDEPLLPSAYTELLVLQSLMPLAMRLNDNTILNMAKNEYRTALEEAKDEVRRTRQLPSVEVDQSAWRTV